MSWAAETNIKGPPGAASTVPGPPGNTVLYGTVNPTAGVGRDGDFYINTATNFIYGPKAAGAWPAGTSLVGPPGASGAGTGNVTGPASAVADRIATYNGTTGTVIKDGGKLVTDFALTAHTHTASNITDFSEAVDDRAAVLIQNGTGITWAYNDAAGTLTPTVTIASYTDEQVDDRVAALLVAGSNITLNYNDAANSLTINGTGSGAASGITFTPTGNIAATNVQTALVELDTEKEPAIASGTTAQYWRGDKSWQTLPTGGGSAVSVTFTPAGNIAATDVQAAIVELDNEKVAKAGDTMTGNLFVNKSNPSLVLQKTASGQGSQLAGYNGVNPRWSLALGDNVAEGGSNTGSNLTLYSYTDAGASIGTPLTIARASGVVNFTATPTVNGTPIGGGGAAVLTSDTPPAGAADNSLWYETDTGVTYIRLNDGNSTQWVMQSGNGAGGVIGGKITIASTAPPSPAVNDAWIDTT